MKVIFHIDMDSFFASCHEAILPEYKGKPLVVTVINSRRSVVSTANYEARKYGVHSGMPLYKAKKLCSNLVMVNLDFQLYVRNAQSIFDLITSKYTDKIEVGSIDECFIDVTDVYQKYGSAYNLAKNIQQEIYDKLGLPCSIGISYNKHIAKIASELKKPQGISIIRDTDIETKLHTLPIEALFGVGKVTLPKFHDMNIYTIGDLAHFKDFELLEHEFGIHAYDFYQRAQGMGSDEINLGRNEHKSIGNEMTLEQDITDFNEAKHFFYYLAQMVAHRAQKRCMKGKVLYVVIKYANKERHSRQKTLPRYIDDFDSIYSIALSIFEDWWDNQPLRLIGVGITRLKSKYRINEQLTFNNYHNYGPKPTHEQLISKINKHYEKDILMTGTKLHETQFIRSSQNKYIESDKMTIKDKEVRMEKRRVTDDY